MLSAPLLSVGTTWWCHPGWSEARVEGDALGEASAETEKPQ